MIIGKVIGNIVSTITSTDYKNRTILIIQPVDTSGKEKGSSFLAIDSVQAGVGDTVLTLDEGGSAKMILKPETNSVKQVVVGIIDHIEKEK
ncbi:MAG: hypothetical protein L3J35_12105 [Bacteroidales bacterium]|nr:hypothetical protein [Bacteroidales bacterium]